MQVFGDTLDDQERLLDNWRGINSECRYLYFKRDRLRKDKAPMAKKTRFVPDHLIDR